MGNTENKFATSPSLSTTKILKNGYIPPELKGTGRELEMQPELEKDIDFKKNKVTHQIHNLKSKYPDLFKLENVYTNIVISINKNILIITLKIL